MINQWHQGDRVIVTFDPSQYGGPGTVITIGTGTADGTVLVELDDGPCVWVESWECAAVPDFPPEPASEPDGCHEWRTGMGSSEMGTAP